MQGVFHVPMLGGDAIALLRSQGLEATLAAGRKDATTGLPCHVEMAADEVTVSSAPESSGKGGAVEKGLSARLQYYVSDANILQQEAVDLLMAAGACAHVCLSMSAWTRS